MIASLLIAAGFCVGAGLPAQAQASQDSDTLHDQYQHRQENAGRDPEANLNLAIWCEQQGLVAERNKHLSMALLANPELTTARGLLGQVYENGRWTNPDQVIRSSTIDESSLLEQYGKKRAQAPLSVAGQLELAQWCEDKGLDSQWRTHLITVLKLDPSRETTWKRLGYKKYQGRWMTTDQVEAFKQDVKAQAEADKKWKPLLARLKQELADPKTRQQAEITIAEVEDPRAVPSILSVFNRGEAEQRIAAQLLGQVDDPDASRALALLALQGASPEIKRIAIETLRNCDVREFAGPLVALLREPLKYEVTPVRGPGTTGVIWVETEKFRHRWTYAVLPPGAQPGMNNRARPDETLLWGPDGQAYLVGNGVVASPPTPARARLGDQLRADPASALAALTEAAKNGGQAGTQVFKTSAAPGAMSVGSVDPFTGYANYVSIRPAPVLTENAIRAQRATLDAETQMRRDIRWLESTNAEISQTNQLVQSIMEPVTGLAFGSEIKPWRGWWLNQVGLEEDNSRYDRPKPVLAREQQFGSYIPVHTSCFAAGTVVHTSTGPQPIETLKVGDVVLSQNVETGTLSYQPITAFHANPPSLIHEIKLDNETIRASQFHRFWKAGHGWVMARDLNPGDQVRVLGGLTSVESVETQLVEPVFNLDVDQNHSYFVGEVAALVHDNTLPNRRVTPFDQLVTAAD